MELVQVSTYICPFTLHCVERKTLLKGSMSSALHSIHPSKHLEAPGTERYAIMNLLSAHGGK